MKPDDDPDNKNNLQGNGSVESTLRLKIAELESDLREEKERFDLLQFEACQEVEKHARDCVSLRENVARLEQDCAILRERQDKDRERIKNLLAEIERIERVFKEKFVELKSEIRDLETAKRRAEDEVVGLRMEKGAVYGELEARAFKLAEENLRLLENENGGKVDDEMPKRNVELVLTPEPSRKRVSEGVDSESEEDRIPIAQFMYMQRCDRHLERSAQLASFGNQSSSCDEIGDSMKLPRKNLFPRKACGEGKYGVKKSSDRTVGDQIPITAANHKRKISKGLLDAVGREYKLLKNNKRSRSKKKFKLVDINYSPMVRNVYIIKADQEEPGENLAGKIAEKDVGGTIKRAKCGRIRNTRHRSDFPKKPSKMEVGVLSNTGKIEDINISDKSVLV